MGASEEAIGYPVRNTVGGIDPKPRAGKDFGTIAWRRETR
jgi:hypothetical protein